MKVIAHQTGFIGGARRRAGDVFEVPSGASAAWFSPVEEPEAAKPEAPAEEPQAPKPTARVAPRRALLADKGEDLA